MEINKLNGVLPIFVMTELPTVIDKFSINTPLRLSHFLAQDAHESGFFRAKQENLNYSANSLMTVFKKYFPTMEEALKYERKPNAIANKVYANRMGNGDEASGDGWKHRGFGYIQLTGKNNQQAFFKAIGLPIDTPPQTIADKYPLLSAGWFWNTNKINMTADKGSDNSVIAMVTKVVNGGTHGLEQRTAYFNKFYNLLKT
jgi:putative chitinase